MAKFSECVPSISMLPYFHHHPWNTERWRNTKSPEGFLQGFSIVGSGMATSIVLTCQCNTPSSVYLEIFHLCHLSFLLWSWDYSTQGTLFWSLHRTLINAISEAHGFPEYSIHLLCVVPEVREWTFRLFLLHLVPVRRLPSRYRGTSAVWEVASCLYSVGTLRCHDANKVALLQYRSEYCILTGSRYTLSTSRPVSRLPLM